MFRNLTNFATNEKKYVIIFLLFLLLSIMIIQGKYIHIYALYILMIFIIIMYCNPVITIGFYIALEILTTLSPGYSKMCLNYGNLNIYPFDILCFILMIISVIRFLKLDISILIENKTLLIFVIFSLLVVIGMFRGIGSYAKSAIGESRPYLYFIAWVWYFSTYRLSKRIMIRLFKLFSIFAVVMVVLGLLRLFGIIPGLNILHFMAAYRFRFNNGEEALFLLYIFFALVVIRLSSVRSSLVVSFFSFFLLLYSIITQNRSVWLAGIVGSIVLMLIYRTRFSKLAFTTTLVMILMICIAFLAFPKSSSFVIDTLKQSGKEPFELSKQNDASWRLQNWTSLLSELNNSLLWIIGKGFGAYFNADVFGNTINTGGPHSVYVNTISRLGILGMLVFLCFIFELLRKLYLIEHQTKDVFRRGLAITLFTCIIASMGFMVAYSLLGIVSILFGISVSYVLQQNSSSYDS